MRFGRIDHAVVDLLLSTPKPGATFDQLMKTVDVQPKRFINKTIFKMKKLGIMFEEKVENNTYYYIPKESLSLIKEIRCPKCNTLKRLYGERQMFTNCDNPTCLTEFGNRSRIWVLPFRLTTFETKLSVQS